MDTLNIKLERPLAFIDLETTGLDLVNDRIVEIAVFIVYPDGKTNSRVRRINPGIPIPPEATAVHGITDDDIKDKPPFARVAGGFLQLIDNADLAGYNVLRYDIPLIHNELQRVGRELDMEGRVVVDVYKLFAVKEPRSLEKVYRFYCDKELKSAHSAEVDAIASFEILNAQLLKYENMPDDIRELGALSVSGSSAWVDPDGKLVWKDDEAVFSFGKNKGKSLREIAAKYPDYLDWIKKSDFPLPFRKLVSAALKGEFPEPKDPSSKSSRQEL